MLKKNWIRLVLSIAVSVLFLWIAFRKVDFPKLWDQLRAVDPTYVLMFVASMVVIQFTRIFRFGVLVKPFVDIDTKTLFRVTNVGMMLILLLPLRLGEFARPYLLKRDAKAPMSAGIGAVAVERTIDGILVTLLFFVTATLVKAPYEVPDALRVAAYGSLALFGGSTVVIIGALVRHQWMIGILRKIGNMISEKLTDKAIGMLEAFISGLHALPNMASLIRVLGYTLIYWTAQGLGFYAVVRAFGWDLPVISGFMLVCVVILGIMIPAGPGFLGTFQGAITIGLSVFAVHATEAAAYGLVVYPIMVLVSLSFGLPYLFAHRGDVREIMQAEAG